ncbi:hypothetical protein SLEP1_g31343 [Rubroshorea leprosula]|uniref:Uncharacterized protein n=1 Tax=Rubroshorea leprosula TaxID=152421 RepID=A0AAV5K5B7_9ROSI|nr:hypothetical protein SLEP1_g31343 [Rubroshorea leprosula]
MATCNDGDDRKTVTHQFALELVGDPCATKNQFTHLKRDQAAPFVIGPNPSHRAFLGRHKFRKTRSILV